MGCIGSIHTSHPAAVGSILGIHKNLSFFKLLKLINCPAWSEVDNGLIILVELIW